MAPIASTTSARSAILVRVVRASLGALLALLVATGAVMASEPAQTPFTLRVPVLMYHRISAAPRDALLPSLWVTPDQFRSQLDLLRRHGWVSVTAQEVVRHMDAHEALPPRSFVITIDDGALDGFTHAAPILSEQGMHATFFVNPGRTGRAWAMSWPQLAALRAAGHEIANHSLTHADLPTLGPKALRRQIAGAQERLSAGLGVRPVTFCYPYGHHSAAVRLAVKAAGLRLAFTTVWGVEESTDSPFQAPRIRVNAGDSPATLLSRLEPFADGR